jgi:hypothetical protein
MNYWVRGDVPHCSSNAVLARASGIHYTTVLPPAADAVLAG